MPYHDEGRDKFTNFAENSFHIVREAPVSTFSIDVDTASYSWVRASLNQKLLPQPAAVRTEEMVNYFHYDYAGPRTTAQPFSTNVAVFPSPWAKGRKLVRIGIRGYDVQRAARPRANLVFLIDTSGSMQEPNKLPLVQRSLNMLLDELDPRDTVAIVTYAGIRRHRAPADAGQPEGADPRRHRQPRRGRQHRRRRRHPPGLQPRRAEPRSQWRQPRHPRHRRRLQRRHHRPGRAQGLYRARARQGRVPQSVLGFGMGNYNDALMQTLAQNGNGTAAYIDTVAEARKTLVEEAGSTLFTIAKDVKIQVEFNPARRRRISADRLRNPGAQPRRFRQ